MDALKRLFGMGEPEPEFSRGPMLPRPTSEDEQAVERYRYLLRTAPPETIEEAHAEAFTQLTPEQRRMVLQELNQSLTPAEQAAGVAYDEEPRSLARLATRAEVRRPGTLERTWSGMPAMSPLGGTGGMGASGLMMNSFLGSFAGVMLGSVVANAFFDSSGVDAGAADAASADASGIENTGVEGGDFGGGGETFGDFGGDFGGFGDFGGGDF